MLRAEIQFFSRFFQPRVSKYPQTDRRDCLRNWWRSAEKSFCLWKLSAVYPA